MKNLLFLLPMAMTGGSMQKGAPESHVIVESDGDELPDRTFEEAGRLAAYYSKNRGADKVEIDYIQKKHVKKPNGAKPGFVVYYTNYSLVIDSDISNIKMCRINFCTFFYNTLHFIWFRPDNR